MGWKRQAYRHSMAAKGISTKEERLKVNHKQDIIMAPDGKKYHVYVKENEIGQYSIKVKFIGQYNKYNNEIIEEWSFYLSLSDARLEANSLKNTIRYEGLPWQLKQ